MGMHKLPKSVERPAALPARPLAEEASSVGACLGRTDHRTLLKALRIKKSIGISII